MAATAEGQTQRSDVITVFVATLGVVISFINIYQFAQRRQPGNAIWAGVALFAFSLLLATQLAKMRRVVGPGQK
jgi:hypothetical protein